MSVDASPNRDTAPEACCAPSAPVSQCVYEGPVWQSGERTAKYHSSAPAFRRVSSYVAWEKVACALSTVASACAPREKVRVPESCLIAVSAVVKEISSISTRENAPDCTS